MITARELRAHFAPRPTPNYFEIAASAARQQAAAAVTNTVTLDSLIVTPDAMPHHYIARAVILDLQPAQLVSAIGVVDDAIRRTYPHAQRSGWRAACDGLTIYFYAWTPTSSAVVAEREAA